MKKFILALIAAVICFSTVCYAGNKITFRDIPWNTPVGDMSTYYLDWGWCYGAIEELDGYGTHQAPYNNNGKLGYYNLPSRIENDYEYMYMMKWHSNPSVCENYGWASMPELMIAGWPVNQVHMYFIDTTGLDMFNSKLCMATYCFSFTNRSVDEFDTAVIDLTTKLNSVYGEGETFTVALENPTVIPVDTTYTFWEDTDGNYVYLLSRVYNRDSKDGKPTPQIILAYTSGTLQSDFAELEHNIVDSVDGL